MREMLFKGKSKDAEAFEGDKQYWKAFIRVIKSLSDGYLGCENVIKEPLIEANSKDEVKTILLDRYPQFFPNNKIYTRETKDEAQFFYVVIYPLFEWEKEKIIQGEWVCSYCNQVHENTYISRPRMYSKLFGDAMFCTSDDDYCLNQYKKEHYKNVEFPDDEYHFNSESPNYIYKITEKETGKCYIGKTRNAPFFRWWNHLTHSTAPFGLHLRKTKLEQWTFEVLEELPYDADESEVFKTETKYMIKYDSINNGFNTLVSNRDAIKNHLNPQLF